MMSIPPNWFCIHPETQLIDPQIPHQPSNCGACECPIAGNTYHCSSCNSSLHPICKNSSPTLSSGLHPHPLTLLNRDFTHSLLRHCAVCSEEIKGVSYTCSPCNFDLHPQCSQLPLLVPCIGGPHSLHLHVAPHEAADCVLCGSHCGKWSYRCDVCSVSIHYWCLSMKLASGEDHPSHQPRGLGGPTDIGFYGHAVASPWAPQPFGHGHYDYYHHSHGYNINPAPGYYYYNNYQGGFQNQGLPWGSHQCYYNNSSNNVAPNCYYNNNQGGFQNQGLRWEGNQWYNNNSNNNVSSYSVGGNGSYRAGKLMGRIVLKMVGSLAVSLLIALL